MARIAFAWELGAAFGHVSSCVALARALAARGHVPAFMFRELRQLAAFPECSAIDTFQAPAGPLDSDEAAQPISYADILLGCGYRSPEVLGDLVARWLEYFRQWRPDLVVADSAPTALLAARMLGLKRVAFGNGFAIPPRLSPLPAFRFDAGIAPQDIGESEAQALSHVNRVMADMGAVPLQSLAQIFETDEDFLCTFPELDHYGSRPRSAYWGPRYSVDSGADVRWPYGEGKRVILYMRNVVPQLDAIIEALVANHCRVAAFVPGLEDARRARLKSPQRIVADRPMHLKPLLETCDLLVSEAGNVATGALMSGVPQLLSPTTYAQFITAVRLERLGSTLWLPPDARAPDVAAALRHMLGESRFKSAARTFAKRYAAFSPAEQERRIVLRIEEILAAPILTP